VSQLCWMSLSAYELQGLIGVSSGAAAFGLCLRSMFAVRPTPRPTQKHALLVRRKTCTFGPAKNMHFWSGEKYALLGRRKTCTFGPAKNMHFGSGEKYALLVRRKICTFGPAKNMHFWSDEKYALLVRRKICTFGPAKNMHFWSGEKYALLVRRKMSWAPSRGLTLWLRGLRGY
jgi:hypothetical protein